MQANSLQSVTHGSDASHKTISRELPSYSENSICSSSSGSSSTMGCNSSPFLTTRAHFVFCKLIPWGSTSVFFENPSIFFFVNIHMNFCVQNTQTHTYTHVRTHAHTPMRTHTKHTHRAAQFLLKCELRFFSLRIEITILTQFSFFKNKQINKLLHTRKKTKNKCAVHTRPSTGIT